MNELHKESSPYLAQHASNPVHWKAWNQTLLSIAQQENKLVIISIGYSSCHWCHVMERESFENEDVAQLMNQHFINIKIDREERPDIDAHYLKAVQLMTGRGGWPMNVVALPNGKPVWGGTYFKKKDWMNALSKIQELHQTKPELLVEYADQLTEGMTILNTIPTNDQPFIDTNQLIKDLILKWKKSFDWDFGGMARAPKFMMPNNYEFLIRYGSYSQDQELLDFVSLTLTKMAHGGIFDVVGGGFSRYSVDLEWHIPHFEKMGYDNGQMVSLYCNAYKVFKNDLYREIVFKTLQFIETEWMTADGSFYSAYDADSANANHILEEGAFYYWNLDELKKLLTTDFDLFATVFNLNNFGHWENGNYVLIQTAALETIAYQNSISVELLKQKKQQWEKTLYTYRKNRPKPLLDDKCLTAWNAIILKGFTDAYKTFGSEKHKTIALSNGNFILNNCWDEKGFLYRNFKNGHASIPAFLEDYAHVIEAFIGLYEITFDESWLFEAQQLTHYCLDHFYDQTQEFFAFSPIDEATFMMPHYELEDNVIPAANSVMARNLFRLSCYFENNHFETVAQKMLHKIVPTIDYASAFSNWLQVKMDFDFPHFELAICGTNSQEYAQKINATYAPNLTLAGTNKASKLPFLQNKVIENKTLFYLCQQKTCGVPTEDFKTILQTMQK